MDNRLMQLDLIFIIVVVAVVVDIIAQSVNEFSVEASSSVTMATANVTSDEKEETTTKREEKEEMETIPELIRKKRAGYVSRIQFLDDNDDDDNYNPDNDDDADAVKPVFLASIQNVTVNPGDRASLTCRVQHLGKKTVTWRRRGDIHPMTIGRFIFVSDRRLKVEHSESGSSDWRLVISDVRESDEGTYQCQINTKDDQYNHFDVHLQVKTMDVRGTETVERGGPIELWCNASGRLEPPHNIEWFKDGHMIESNRAAGITITKKIEAHLLVSILVIRRSKISDSGVYHCRTTTTSSSSSSAVDSSQTQSGGRITVRILNAPMEKRADKAYEMNSSNTGFAVYWSWFTVATCSYIFWKL